MFTFELPLKLVFQWVHIVLFDLKKKKSLLVSYLHAFIFNLFPVYLVSH